MQIGMGNAAMKRICMSHKGHCTHRTISSRLDVQDVSSIVANLHSGKCNHVRYPLLVYIVIGINVGCVSEYGVLSIDCVVCSALQRRLMD